ncbi:MAG: hypothetical protein JNL83_15440 [Myxococcales bacterium]|nr:hypothetical protein [Myxococcales bacterium]
MSKPCTADSPARLLSAVVAVGLGVVASCQSLAADAPSCAAVADHVSELFGGDSDAHARELRGVFATRCAEDRWSDAARTCIAATRSLGEPRGCKTQLSSSQIAALDREVAQAESRELARTIPAACLRYEAVLSVVARCESFPATARRDLAEKLVAFKATWSSAPDKRALEPTCSAAIGAVKLAAAGCPGAGAW